MGGGGASRSMPEAADVLSTEPGDEGVEVASGWKTYRSLLGLGGAVFLNPLSGCLAFNPFEVLVEALVPFPKTGVEDEAAVIAPPSSLEA